MSSNIMHFSGYSPATTSPAVPVVGAEPPDGAKNPSLLALGDRVRRLRARRGMTRKALAVAAGVSERHLANLEYGIGNASFLVLQQVSVALQCSLAELIGDVSTASPEWLLLRELLTSCDETMLRRVRIAVSDLLGKGGASGVGPRSHRLALIGLRGAGKSTLGQRLADDLGFASSNSAGRSRSLPAAASPRSRAFTARALTAATSVERWRRRSRSIPRR